MDYRKNKRTNNDPQNTTRKTKDCVTSILQKPGLNSGVPEGKVVLVSLVAPVMVLQLRIRWYVMD